MKHYFECHECDGPSYCKLEIETLSLSPRLPNCTYSKPWAKWEIVATPLQNQNIDIVTILEIFHKQTVILEVLARLLDKKTY